MCGRVTGSLVHMADDEAEGEEEEGKSFLIFKHEYCGCFDGTFLCFINMSGDAAIRILSDYHF